MKKFLLAALVLGGSLTMTSCGGGDEAKVRELAKITCEMSKITKDMFAEKDPEKRKALEERVKQVQEKGKSMEEWGKSLQEKMKNDTVMANKVRAIMEEEMKKCDVAK